LPDERGKEGDGGPVLPSALKKGVGLDSAGKTYGGMKEKQEGSGLRRVVPPSQAKAKSCLDGIFPGFSASCIVLSSRRAAGGGIGRGQAY